MAQVPSNLIPTRITQLPADANPSQDGIMMYVHNGVTYSVRVGDLLNVVGVPASRQVIAGSCMTGGGPLLTDITLSVRDKSIDASQLTNTGVTAGSYGDSNATPVIVVDSTGRVISVTLAPISSTSGGTVRSIDVSGGVTGLTTAGGPVTGTGVVTLGGVLNISSGGTGATTDADAPYALKGPNADVTSMTGVTGGISTPDFVAFDVTATPVLGVGKLQWDPDYGTLQFGLLGGNVNLQVGQEQNQRVLNKTGATLLNGTVVRVTGAQGQRTTIALAQADSDANSATILGVLTEDILNNQQGYCTTEGLVHGLDTTAFAEGDVLWLSPTVPGGMTATKPVAPQHLVMIGYCVKVNGPDGHILVKVQNGYELDELHDVKITSVANNQVLTYDNTIPAWKNVAPSTLSVGTAAALAGGAASQLAYQSGANVTAFLANGTTGQVLKSTGATAPAWASGVALTSSNDTNVTLTLGGSAATALVNTASLTLGWSGLLSVARGGTNSSATPTAGGATYGTGTAYAFTAAGTVGQVLTSTGATAPVWGGVSGGTF